MIPHDSIRYQSISCERSTDTLGFNDRDFSSLQQNPICSLNPVIFSLCLKLPLMNFALGREQTIIGE